MRKTLTLTFAGVLSCAAPANIASFDSLIEGSLGSSFTDGGIHFYNPDNYTPEGSPFVCERADGTLSGPYFSSPNTLTLTGYSPGPGAAYSRVGSFYASTGSVADYASVEVFYFFLVDVGNVITLEGLLNGNVVVSDSFTVTTPSQAHATLMIEGEYFDEIRIVGSGDYQSGAMFALFDNITIIPAPGALLPFGLIAFTRRRR